MQGENSLVVPNFLRAGSLKGLVRLCLKNNIAKGVKFHYFDFQKHDGKWICFYEEKVSIFIPNKLLREESKDEKMDTFLEEYKK